MKFYETNLNKSAVILRIDKDEEVISTIKEVSKKLNIESGFFWGIGAVNQATISFYDHQIKSYIDKEINQDCEVISLVGNISYKYAENEIFVHAHISLSTKEFGIIAGHLKKAIVSVTLEVVFLSINDKIERVYDQDFNLYLWKP